MFLLRMSFGICRISILRVGNVPSIVFGYSMDIFVVMMRGSKREQAKPERGSKPRFARQLPRKHGLGTRNVLPSKCTVCLRRLTRFVSVGLGLLPLMAEGL